MKTANRFFTMFLVLLLTLTFLTYIPVYAADAELVITKILEDGARFHKENNSNSKIFILIPDTNKSAVSEHAGEWYRMMYDELTGYILERFLNIPGEQDANNERVNERAGEWYKITRGDLTGYVLGEYFPPAKNAEAVISPASVFGAINCYGVNLREEGSMKAKVLTVLGKGTELVVYEQIGGWYRVKTGDWFGFIFSEYITLSEMFG